MTLKKDAGEIEGEVACAEAVWVSPECAERMHVHGWEIRRWRNLDSCQFKTFVTASVPRVRCSTHGTQMVRVLWAKDRNRFKAWFERFAIDVLKGCTAKATCDIPRTSWDEADGIKQRTIDPGLWRRTDGPVKRLCIDEKVVDWSNTYITIVDRADGGSALVLGVEDGREESSLNRFWRRPTKEQGASVQRVAMDMWEAYRNSALKYVPEAENKIVYDNFHLPRYMNRAVDEVRRQEHFHMTRAGKDTLKETRQFCLYGLENVPHNWASRFRELRQAATKSAPAWKVKELLRALWGCSDEADALSFFQDWYREAMATCLEPVNKVVRLFKKHWPNIMMFFRYHLSNALAEGINSRIQHLIQKACGYRNRERFKRDVLFRLGALDLHSKRVQ